MLRSHLGETEDYLIDIIANTACLQHPRPATPQGCQHLRRHILTLNVANPSVEAVSRISGKLPQWHVDQRPGASTSPLTTTRPLLRTAYK